MRTLNPELLKVTIEKTVAEDTAESRIGGICFAVSQEGKPVYRGFFGALDAAGSLPVTDKTVFRLASMSKPITAVAALMVRDRGLFDLDDEVAEYLPAYRKMTVGTVDGAGNPVAVKEAQTPITLHHLLTHTSGIACGEFSGKLAVFMTEEDRRTVRNTVAFYAGMPLSFEPFSAQAYSGTGAFDVLVGVIEQVTGEPYDRFLAENLFDPLGMTDTTFAPTREQWARMIDMHDRVNEKSAVGRTVPGCVFENYPPTHFLGGAGLASTLADYTRFAEMLLGGGELDGVRVLREESVKEMGQAHVPAAIMPGSERWGLGVRVIVGGNTLPVGAFGWSGAYGTHFWVDPVNRLTAVMMKNSRHDGGSGNRSARRFEADVYASLA